MSHLIQYLFVPSWYACQISNWFWRRKKLSIPYFLHLQALLHKSLLANTGHSKPNEVVSCTIKSLTLLLLTFVWQAQFWTSSSGEHRKFLSPWKRGTSFLASFQIRQISSEDFSYQQSKGSHQDWALNLLMTLLDFKWNFRCFLPWLEWLVLLGRFLGMVAGYFWSVFMVRENWEIALELLSGTVRKGLWKPWKSWSL